MDKVNPGFGKEFINSTGILLVVMLANFVLTIALALLLGPLFFYFNFIPVLIGPFALIIFIIRGIWLFHKTRNIKLVSVSVVVPFLIFPTLIFLAAVAYPPLNNLPINLFRPETDFVIQKIKVSKLNRLAASIEVNPAKLCVVRRDYGETGLTGRTGAFYMYKWVIEWQGTIKFPQGDGSSGHFFSSIENPPGKPITPSRGSAASFETADGTSQIVDEFNGNGFSSDGNSHKWDVIYQPNDVSDKENTINFYVITSYPRVSSEKSYYTLTIPEPLIQKLQSIGEVDNTPGYTFEEYYIKPLTEMERRTGEVCVSLGS